MPKTDGVQSLHGAVVFCEQGIWFLLGVSGLATAFGLQSLAFIAAALAMLWLVARLWSALAPERIGVEEKGMLRRVFPGETVSARLTVTNGKWLPVPWLEVSRSRTGGLQCLAGSPYRLQNDRLVCRMGWLAGWQEASWPVTWCAGRRGAYRAQPSLLRCGDPASFFYSETWLPGEEGELLVYPRLFSLPEVTPGWQQALGDRRSVDFRFQDPLLVAGLREYQPGDPLRRINWVASARTGSLKANIWEASAQVSALICLETLALAACGWEAASGDLAFELLVSAAASLACQLAGSSGEVGFLSDVSDPFGAARGPCYLPASAGRGQRHETAMLEVMARLKAGSAVPPGRLVDKVRLPLRCTLILVSACWSEALAGGWERAWPGRRLIWFALEGASGAANGRQVYPLFPGWRDDAGLKAAVMGSAGEEALL